MGMLWTFGGWAAMPGITVSPDDFASSAARAGKGSVGMEGGTTVGVDGVTGITGTGGISGAWGTDG